MSGEVVTIYDELKEYVNEALGDMPGVRVDSNRFYYSECDKDYSDVLEDADIADVLAGRYRYYEDGVEKIKHMPPRDVLTRYIEYGYMEESVRVENELVDELKENENIARIMKSFNIDEEWLRDYLEYKWYAKLPFEDYLKQEVCMDIMLDTGDRNYEFTCNNLASRDIENIEDFDDNSSLLWLCEQQGVTREELLAAFDKGTAHSDEVSHLWKRQGELVDELKNFGLKEPRFNERVFHTGAYWEFTRLKEHAGDKKREINKLQANYRDNNLTYSEYLKKHFDKYERLDPMTEEQFNVRKSEVLDKLSERIKKTDAELAAIQDKLDHSVDFGKIAALQSERKEIMWRIGELAKTDEYKKAEFINSVHNEILNTYGSSVVTFLVKMTLDDAIKLQDVINNEKEVNNSYYYEERQGLSSIVLDKGVQCGLMDDCSGGGSVFEIKLLKDVEIPIKALYKAVPDRDNGNYGFMEIYGTDEASFKPALKEIKEVPLQKVNDLISKAEQACDEMNKDVTCKNDIEIGKE